jgi:DNA invertase Pin-like site-specific DNA recombinase
VRVVGYVRDAVDPHEGEPSFSQSEKIRRWTTDNGHQLVSVCQDLRTPGRELGRDGLRALIGIAAAGQVDAVVVSSLSAFSPDKVTQEVMIDDLRARNVAVMTVDEHEQDLLEDPCPDQIRLLLRDVLAKARRHKALFGMIGTPSTVPTEFTTDAGSDVVVELVPPLREPDTAGMPNGS